MEPSSAALIRDLSGEQRADHESQSPGDETRERGDHKYEEIRGQFGAWHPT